MSAPLTTKQLKIVAKAYLEMGGVAGAQALGLNYNTFRARVRAAKDSGLLMLQGVRKPQGNVLDAPPAPATAVIDKLVKAKFDAEQERLKDQVRDLKAQIESVRRETMDAEYIKEKIIGVRDSLDDIPA